MDFGPETIRLIVTGMVTLILSIAVHEFGHAYVAHKLGDRLPQSQGRVTLNPIAHADPIGTLALPMMGLLFAGGIGFGWGRPVQVNPLSFTRRLRMRIGHLLVAAAGPAMNVLFGTFIAIVHVTLLATGVLSPSSPFHLPLQYAVMLNFILAFFNLIPAPPLDGSAILEGVLPERHLATYHKYAVYGPFLIMAVILVPGMYKIFAVPAQWCQKHLYAGLGVVFGL
jgi:Zn-dependent protease